MKKIAILGLGISGKSVLDFYIKKNKSVIVIDDNQKSLDDLLKKYQNNANLLKNLTICKKSDSIDWLNVEFIVSSPGIDIENHEIIKEAKKNKVKIVGDIELFYNINKNKNFIGITGTNGKSTTISLISHIFKENNVDHQTGGNIGIACFDLKESKNYLFEMSSYQLDLSRDLHFNIAAILNITPDHLKRHKTMQNYIEAKKKIFLNQNKDDLALINIDDKNCYKIYQDLQKDDNFIAKLVPLSLKVINNEDKAIINHLTKEVIKIPDLKNLKGNHNKQNIVFSYIIASYMKISDKNIIESLKTFKGLKHRLEFVKKIANISFINDSKATNVESALCALESYDNIFWIAGGEAKNDDLEPILKYKKHIKKAFLIGKDQEKFAKFLIRNKIENHLCSDLDNAFLKAVGCAKEQNEKINIILSPACASFDQWSNFEERGDYFCKLINKLS